MPPTAMLACAICEWPGGEEWVLEPKYDGDRLVVEATASGRVCAWSRHGTSLTERVGRRATIVFSRTDAVGGLREARLLHAADPSDNGEPDAIQPPYAPNSAGLRRLTMTGLGELR